MSIFRCTCVLYVVRGRRHEVVRFNCERSRQKAYIRALSRHCAHRTFTTHVIICCSLISWQCVGARQTYIYDVTMVLGQQDPTVHRISIFPLQAVGGFSRYFRISFGNSGVVAEYSIDLCAAQNSSLWGRRKDRNGLKGSFFIKKLTEFAI